MENVKVITRSGDRLPVTAHVSSSEKTVTLNKLDSDPDANIDGEVIVFLCYPLL